MPRRKSSRKNYNKNRSSRRLNRYSSTNKKSRNKSSRHRTASRKRSSHRTASRKRSRKSSRKQSGGSVGCKLMKNAFKNFARPDLNTIPTIIQNFQFVRIHASQSEAFVFLL